jgi:hypothetical protein
MKRPVAAASERQSVWQQISIRCSMPPKQAITILIAVLTINFIVVGGYFWLRFSTIQKAELDIARSQLRSDLIGVGIVPPDGKMAILSNGEMTTDTVYFKSIDRRTNQKHITKVGDWQTIWVDISFSDWFFSETRYPDLSPTPMSLTPFWFAIPVPLLAISLLASAVLAYRRRNPLAV